MGVNGLASWFTSCKVTMIAKNRSRNWLWPSPYMTELCLILKWCSFVENSRPRWKSSPMKVLLKSEMMFVLSPSASRDATNYAFIQTRNSVIFCNRPVPIAASRCEGPTQAPRSRLTILWLLPISNLYLQTFFACIFKPPCKRHAEAKT